MSAGGGDRYERAARQLERFSGHLHQSVNRTREALDQGRAAAAEALGSQSYPPERVIPDLLSLSLNLIGSVSCCLLGPAESEPIEGGPVTSTALAASRLHLVFDTMSESAGPVELQLDELGVVAAQGTPLAAVPPGSASDIPADRLLVRVLDTGVLIVKLAGLRNVAAGNYSGTLTLTGFANGIPRTLPVTAECRRELFWIV